MPRYHIGLIAAPRQNTYKYRPHPDSLDVGRGTTPLQRGTWQYTGHTAIYFRKDNQIQLCKGLVPNRIRALSAVKFGKTVPAHWQDDSKLFRDPTSVTFELDLPQHIAEKFPEYLASAQSELKLYTLRPQNMYQCNCVLLGFF